MTEMTGKCIKQFVKIAEKDVRFLLDQVAINRFIAAIVLEKMIAQEISKEEMTEDEGETTEDEEETEIEEDRKCIEQPVKIAEEIVKFLLDQLEANPFIVVTVLKKDQDQVQADLTNQAENMMKSM